MKIGHESKVEDVGRAGLLGSISGCFRSTKERSAGGERDWLVSFLA